MKWETLISSKRVGSYQKSSQKKSTDLRSEFEKDYHRIIGSASFRRLQDKTQVFPLDKSDFIRTRLTHSLEVSSIAKSLGQNIGAYILEHYPEDGFDFQTKSDICDILQCAGLIHDIGNPPFGHFGEEAIRDWFRKNLRQQKVGGQPIEELLSPQQMADFYNFEGNAQALRLVSKLHFLVNEKGMNLTYGLLNTIIKYPNSSLEIDPKSGNVKDKKMGYFYSEQELFHDIAAATETGRNRHPLTFILEAADDIAYRTADIEDAFKKGCISYDDLVKELKKTVDGYPIQVLDQQYARAKEWKITNPEQYAVQNWLVRMQGYFIFSATEGFTSHYKAIMQGSYPYDLFHHTPGEKLITALGRIAHDYVFTSMPILKLEIAANTIITYLLDKMVPAVLQYDEEEPMGMMEGKYVRLISENYRQIYHTYAKGKSREEKVYLRLMLVTDYISGMTDSFAKDLYQQLNGIA
ncbi:MAG: deoxyguanosinetriphosphate triphosphohydrolase [Lachnospiraceae bacterium]|nr:deoxyguanosinetriphosphate triphosphohydrolase [Lachnospiraceae bacterium]